jgi:beta-RFAP synthase
LVAERAQKLRVTAPARLHMGFLDLEGGLGRRFGSLGLTIDAFATRLLLARASGDVVDESAEAGRVRAVLAQLADLGLPRARVTIESAIPTHAGLGSGTQLGLALGVGLARLGGLGLGAREVARLLERGARSGIGIGAFEQGGFLLDGGRGDADGPPPITARLEFPPAWRLLLVLDRARAGLHGKLERNAFSTLPSYPAELAGHLCRLVVMRLLPGLATADIEAVGGAVGEVQRWVGDHFAPAQGARFTSPAVADALAWLEAQGIPGVGQSSWGPTGFAILADEDGARHLHRAATRRFAQRHPSLSFVVTRARNRGAVIELSA